MEIITTNDKEKQRTSGGEIYQDNTAAEFYCSALTISESPVQAGVIWVGTDDGNIQLTRDGGKHWNNVNKNVPGLPAYAPGSARSMLLNMKQGRPSWR